MIWQKQYIVGFNPIEVEGDAGAGKKGTKKTLLLVFPLQLLQTQELVPKTSGQLVLTFLPQLCKLSSLHLVLAPKKLEPRVLLKKAVFQVKSL